MVMELENVIQRALLEQMLGNVSTRNRAQSYTDPSSGEVFAPASLEKFAGFSPKSQQMHIEHLRSAPDPAFSVMFPEARIHAKTGITTELINSLLRPYLDVQRTGLPQGY
jgi:hypothetical protein